MPMNLRQEYAITSTWKYKYISTQFRRWNKNVMKMEDGSKYSLGNKNLVKTNINSSFNFN